MEMDNFFFLCWFSSVGGEGKGRVKPRAQLLSFECLSLALYCVRVFSLTFFFVGYFLFTLGERVGEAFGSTLSINDI